ncbi:hypothetical protein ENT52713_45940 [Enterobacter sp. 200527-13]|uniref:hypothetical protein n=1 Tax=Enterobacter sp. 200527-13 TaxID=2995131 RepID=UPI0022C25AF9|nr:hypothetical protein [Enterobacter sp. 200527-13]GLH27198.1 hypothetical protein ENT52713_45940 [Enterobacter sp. 200527-13]
MHIDDLIRDMLEVLLLITGTSDMQDFLNRYSESDQLAMLSAYRIGIRYYGYDSATLKQDDEPVNRAVDAHISPADYAKLLFSKRGELSKGLGSFLRCTTQQQRNAF